jgi:hypothetical protein
MILLLPRILVLLLLTIIVPVSSFLILPAGVEAASLQLGPLHKNFRTGISSVFSYVNIGTSTASYDIDFYRPNGELVVSVGPFFLPPEGDCANPCKNTCGQSYNMSSAPVVDSFVGYVIISSDQPFEACINTPEYSTISGAVYQSETNLAGIDPLPQSTDFINISADNVWESSHLSGIMMLLLD